LRSLSPVRDWAERAPPVPPRDLPLSLVRGLRLFSQELMDALVRHAEELSGIPDREPDLVHETMRGNGGELLSADGGLTRPDPTRAGLGDKRCEVRGHGPEALVEAQLRWVVAQ
jgi:hypothetical protein